MSRGMGALVLTLIASAVRPARGQAAAPPQIAGCYAVSIGIWSPALGQDARLHAIPTRVRLDSIAVERGAWRLSPNIEADAGATPTTPRWQMVFGDDVRLTWDNGGTLTIAQLIPVEGEGLIGEVVALSDARTNPDPGAQWWNNEPPGSRAPARLERRPCSEGPETASHRASANGVAARPWLADQAVADRVAGCYELVAGSWQTDSLLAQVQTIPRGPVRIELSNVPDPDETRLSALERATYFETRSSALFTTWVRTSEAAPTILISQPLPMAGFSLRVIRRGADLVGSIEAFTDAVPPGGRAAASHAVRARRIPCSSLRR